jgi:hypothetical protein
LPTLAGVLLFQVTIVKLRDRFRLGGSTTSNRAVKLLDD